MSTARSLHELPVNSFHQFPVELPTLVGLVRAVMIQEQFVTILAPPQDSGMRATLGHADQSDVVAFRYSYIAASR